MQLFQPLKHQHNLHLHSELVVHVAVHDLGAESSSGIRQCKQQVGGGGQTGGTNELNDTGFRWERWKAGWM